MQLKQWRIYKGWSQEQLASLSGLSVRTIQRIEKGQPASLESTKSLAATFELDLEQMQHASPPSFRDPSHQQSDQQQIEQTQHLLIRWMNAVAIIAILFLINYFTGHDYWWAKWPALGIILSLLLEQLRPYQQRWLGKRQSKKAASRSQSDNEHTQSDK